MSLQDKSFITSATVIVVSETSEVKQCIHLYSGVPRNFVRGRVHAIQLRTEERGQEERGSGGGSPLLRGSGGSCNLVQEISFHIVKFS